MYDSPISLEEICLDTICHNLNRVFDFSCESGPGERESSSDDEFMFDRYTVFHKKFTFKDSEFYLCKVLSEALLRKLSEKNLLNDTTLNIFSQKNTRLQRIRIKNARKVTFEGLKILRDHDIRCLECVHLKNICVDRILECLSTSSRDNLTALNVSQCSFIDNSRHFLVTSLTQLKNLRSLNVAYTEFNQLTLQVVCEDLSFLEQLDVSGTGIVSLAPLLKFADQLTCLAIADVKVTRTMASVITQLSKLRHLDLSICNDLLDVVDHAGVAEILENPAALLELVSLDISGWKDFTSKELIETYVRTHAKLRYLGLVLNLLVFEFSESLGRLVIAGVANEGQIKVTLARHYERSSYVQKALYHLFQLTSTYKETRPDMFEAILPAMEAHPSKFGVQMAATACLYNLTRGDLSKQIHPKLLSTGVRLTLDAMEQFPDEYQLQKNALLTLCSDRILQEVNFERFRCAKLVLDSLCAFNETNMNRMAVAICSILAAKVSTLETSELGARPLYMKKLLEMVQSRVDTKSSDITMKFTLSALWNLTDESVSTCTAFLEQGGASLFLNVLKIFKEDSAIETKVLGLLNNIAEVKKLRNSLMVNSLIEELHELLRCDLIDVSYFAAGIVAHLASDLPMFWTVNKYTRAEMLEELEKAVTRWKVPESEMVAYRSFRPFFSLLGPGADYQVQLWAVWAVHHVCTKNPSRYCQMLSSEGGVGYLETLLGDESTNGEVKQLSSQVLQLFDNLKSIRM